MTFVTAHQDWVVTHFWKWISLAGVFPEPRVRTGGARDLARITEYRTQDPPLRLKTGFAQDDAPK